MKQRNILPGVFAALGMLILILDSKTALMGAGEGLELCLKTVIPSLFPFFILSGILVNDLMGSSLPLLRPLGRLLGMPESTEPLLISGFLGGYPVGAKCVHDAWEKGCIEKGDAERLLTFCNNAGPAFLFGMAAPMFSDPAAGWILWGIHIFSAVLTGMFFRQEPGSGTMAPRQQIVSISETMRSSLSVTAQVCGWVIVFRILGVFLDRWFLFLLPDWIRTSVIGLLELANGCAGLYQTASEKLRFLLCSGFLAFGGVCVGLQTMSVTRGLELKWYFRGKLLQMLLSILLSAIYLGLLSPLWLLVLPFLAAFEKKGKKGSIPEPIRV